MKNFKIVFAGLMIVSLIVVGSMQLAFAQYPRSSQAVPTSLNPPPPLPPPPPVSTPTPTPMPTPVGKCKTDLECQDRDGDGSPDPAMECRSCDDGICRSGRCRSDCTCPGNISCRKLNHEYICACLTDLDCTSPLKCLKKEGDLAGECSFPKSP